jgi:hypothetical protein
MPTSVSELHISVVGSQSAWIITSIVSRHRFDFGPCLISLQFDTNYVTTLFYVHTSTQLLSLVSVT